jgi:hypothetical protein
MVVTCLYHYICTLLRGAFYVYDEFKPWLLYDGKVMRARARIYFLYEEWLSEAHLMCLINDMNENKLVKWNLINLDDD